MKKLVIAATALLISTQAIAQSRTITEEHMIGCENKATYEQLQDYVSDGDEDAFNQVFYPKLMYGQCTMFEKGESVFVSDTTWSHVKLRRKGETTSYWTMTQSIL